MAQLTNQNGVEAYAELLERWRQLKTRIDAAIEDRLKELPEAEAISVAKYIALGGKRLRGFLVVELASSLGADEDEALDAAVAVELVHAASLALDDIIDEDIVRRGKKAAWVSFGIKKAVMVSNILIPFAQNIVYQRYGSLALLRTVAAWLDISRGEIIDAFYDADHTDPSLYIEMVRLKTGALFRLSAELGAIAAKAYDLIDSVSEIGENIGIMYQVADDIKDSNDPMKRNEPGLRLFRRWLNGEGSEKALLFIKNMLVRTHILLNKTFGERSSTIRLLPELIVNAMLGNIDADAIRSNLG